MPCRGLDSINVELEACLTEFDIPSYSTQGALNVQSSSNFQRVRVDFANRSQDRIDLGDPLNVRLDAVSAHSHLVRGGKETYMHEVNTGEGTITEERLEIFDADIVE